MAAVHTGVARTFVGHAVASRVLTTMLELDMLADVAVVAGGKAFQCHRAVLAASSPVFRAMFVASMRESSSGRVELHDVRPDVFSAVRDFMYGRPLCVTDAAALELSAFVQRYDVGGPEVRDFLDALLTSALTLDNVMVVRAHADANASDRLRRNCDRFIARRMSKLPENAAFLASPPAAAIAALRSPRNVSRDTLARQTAQHVFAAAIAWVRHDPVARRPELDAVLDTVEIRGLSLPALVRASRDPIALDSDQFQRRLLLAFAAKADRNLGFYSGGNQEMLEQPTSEERQNSNGILGSGFPYPLRRRSSLAGAQFLASRQHARSFYSLDERTDEDESGLSHAALDRRNEHERVPTFKSPPDRDRGGQS